MKKSLKEKKKFGGVWIAGGVKNQQKKAPAARGANPSIGHARTVTDAARSTAKNVEFSLMNSAKCAEMLVTGSVKLMQQSCRSTSRVQ